MNQNSMTPEAQPYRSFVYRQLQAAGAHFSHCRQAAIAAGYAGSDIEQARLQHLALADLSPLPRLGFKGIGVPAWLQGQGVNMPEAANTAVADPQYGLVARLGHNELLLLGRDAAQGDAQERLTETWQAGGQDIPAQGNLLLRAHSHACFGLYGAFADQVLAKLCAVDLRPQTFARHAVALTSVARVGAIIVRDDVAGVTGYQVLVDGSYAVYLLDCLSDAMAEFDGDFIGVDALAAAAG